MILKLPELFGVPAEHTMDNSDKFVAAPVAIHQGRLEVLSYAEMPEQLVDIRRAVAGLYAGRLPGQAGFVNLGNGSVGAFDVQAAGVDGSGITVYPQPKEFVDPESKEPKFSGVLLFSSFRSGGVVTKLAGVVLNPDNDPWLADELGVDHTFNQNNYGQVIVPYDGIMPFVTPNNLCLESGSFWLPRRVN